MIKSIVILIVMVLINLALIFAIIRLVKRTDENLKKFFLEKTSNVFYERKNQDDEINEAKQDVELNKKIETQYLVNDIDKTAYKNNNFKDDYKSIKEEMNFNKADVILNVMYCSNKENDSLSEVIKNLNNTFDFETVYELSTVPETQQIKILQDVFDDKQKQFLNNYITDLGNRKFDITIFFNYVKEQAKLVDENFYIKTGSVDETFDDLGKNVVTVHDDNIVEGIKVVHKNKMYDYSI